MKTATAPDTKQSLDPRLRQRIVELSSSTEPEEFPPLGADVDTDTLERWQTEQQFQRALVTRTWWRLSPQERAAVRAKLLAEQPDYGGRFRSAFSEMYCIEELRRVLDEARQQG